MLAGGKGYQQYPECFVYRYGARKIKPENCQSITMPGNKSGKVVKNRAASARYFGSHQNPRASRVSIITKLALPSPRRMLFFMESVSSEVKRGERKFFRVNLPIASTDGCM